MGNRSYQSLTGCGVLAALLAASCTDSPPASYPLNDADSCGALCDGMVFMSPGAVLLGSPNGEGSVREQPQTIVVLPGYWIDQFEVTNAEYRAFLLSQGNACSQSGMSYPCHDCFEFAKQDSGLDCDAGFDIKMNCQANPAGDANQSCAEHPVVNVTPAGASAYCAWRGKALPSEAEWERAANGPAAQDGTPWLRFPWGQECPAVFNTLGDVFVGDLSGCVGPAWSSTTALANCSESDCSDGFERTAPVGSFPAGDTVEGVSDMAGNVLERVSDCYHASYASGDGPPTDGSPWMTDCDGAYTIARGSGFMDPGGGLRNRARTDEVSLDSADPDVGFRCVVRELHIRRE